MEQSELYWLAGLLEADGTFCQWFTVKNGVRSPMCNIQLNMSDLDTVQKAQKLLEVQTITKRKQSGLGTKQMYQITQGKRDTVKRLALELYPLMSKRRQEQIEALIWTCENLDRRVQ